MTTIIDSRSVGRLVPHYRYDRAQCVIFAGKRGMGKTTAIKSYIDVREPRLLKIDHYDDFPEVPLAESLQSALQDLADAWPGPCRRRLIPALDGVDLQGYADHFFAACFDNLRDALVAGNEISLLSKPHASVELTRFITQGRRLGLRFVGDSQRLAQVPYVIQSECTNLITFRITRPRDRRALEDWADEDIARLAGELAVGECIAVEL